MHKLTLYKTAFIFALSVAVGCSAISPVYAEEVAQTGANAGGEYTFEDSTVEELSDQDAVEAMQPAAAQSRAAAFQLIELGGVDRYGTVTQEANAAYTTSTYAIVTSGVGYADSISAAGLAGALDCPILLTQVDSVPQATIDSLKAMGVKHIVLLGSKSVASNSVEQQLASKTGATVERVGGVDRYATQYEIYQYGLKHNLWNTNYAVVVSGTNFPDALSVSPVSFALKAPVFFCDYSLGLTSADKQAINAATNLSNFLLIGSTSVTSSNTEQYLSGLAAQRGGTFKRLSGVDRYNTSIEIAKYAVANLGFSWNNAAFASGCGPYDSLGGGVLQGKQKAVLLLTDSVSWNSVYVIPKGTNLSSIKFFGSTSSISVDVRRKVCQALGLYYYQNVEQTIYPISLATMATLQTYRGENQSYSSFLSALDPSQYAYGTASFYQFAKLNSGYTNVSADTLNTFIANNCSWSESHYGRRSTLRNMGQAFVNAAKTYGVNEVYLMCHAIWESGWGCSELAGGWTPSSNGKVVVNGVSYPYYAGTTYYNYFGIGAVDSGPLSGGRAMAVKEGWTSPEKAIMGAAKWIKENYLNNSQNTLYLMKWDVAGAANTGSAWHEYCTGLNSWVLGIARNMDKLYSLAGYSVTNAPVTFNVPMYTN